MKKAYQLLDQLFSQNEEPLSILGAFFLLCGYVSGQGGASERTARHSPFRIRGIQGQGISAENAERSAKGISEEGLRRSLDLLLQADLQLKGSKLDARIVMEELIAKLLLAAKGEAA